MFGGIPFIPWIPRKPRVCENCKFFGEVPDPISPPRGGQETKWANCTNPKIKEGGRRFMQDDELCFWEFGDCKGCAAVLTVGSKFSCKHYKQK